jgi:hypothetical protein
MGVTHLSIALANYLANVLNMKTALVEVGERNALIHVPKTGRVHYFPQTKGDELGRIRNLDFQYIVLDVGADSRLSREEFLRCDGKIVLGSLSPWKSAVYYDYMKKIEMMVGDLRSCTFLSLFGDSGENKKCRRICKVPVKSVPFMKNPFFVKGDETSFLQSLI